MTEKLHKVLARAGLGSRRLMEQWIEQGRIHVDGHAAQLGERVDMNVVIEVDGKPLAQHTLQTASTPKVLLYHKPCGEICTRNDPQGRETVFTHFPALAHGRWILVGRLDINTSGLLLVTDSGDLANRLMHPATQIEREYLVHVLGEVTDTMLAQLRRGVMLDEGLASFKRIIAVKGRGEQHCYRVVLTRGLNREVRRLWASQGLTVSRLSRIRYGSIKLPQNLPAGEYRELTNSALQTIFEDVDR